MKRLALGLIKSVFLGIIITASGLALHNHYTGEDFDPVKEIRQLINQNQRDTALDMTEFFRKTQSDRDAIDQLQRELEYSVLEKAKSFVWNGIIKGEVYDSYSGLGAVSSDLFIIGDIRDLGIQSWKYLTDSEDFDKWILILAAGGIGLTGTSFVNGCDSLAKNTVKYVKKLPISRKTGVVTQFLSGGLPRQYHEPIWKLFKANDRSIPKTVNILSKIDDPKQIHTALDLVSNHKRAGNVFINLSGEKGLSVYASTPGKMRKHFIEVFRRNPRAVLGLTKSHLVLHAIKIAKKHHVSAPLVLIAGISLLLALVPISVSWGVFIASSGYAVISIPRIFRRRKIGTKKGERCGPPPGPAD